MSGYYKDEEPLSWSLAIGGAAIIFTGLLYLVVAVPIFWNQWLEEVYWPWTQGDGIIVLSSFRDNFPIHVSASVMLLWLGITGMLAGPLRLSRATRKKLGRPVMWLGIMTLLFAGASKPVVMLAGAYLENQGYAYCSELSERTFWRLDNAYVTTEDYCPR